MTEKKIKSGDVSKEEVLESMKMWKALGFICFIKWTCEKCGERIACETPNTFFEQGYIHRDCGYTSFPKGYGLVVMKGFKNKK